MGLTGSWSLDRDSRCDGRLVGSAAEFLELESITFIVTFLLERASEIFDLKTTCS